MASCQELVLDFVTAVASALSCDEYDNLSERVQVLSEAISTIEQQVPDAKKGVLGTCLGSTLIQFPAGDSFLTQSRIALASAKVSIAGLLEFGKHVSKFEALVKNKVMDAKTNVEELAMSPNGDLGAVNVGLRSLVISYNNDLKEVMDEFKPGPLHGSI